jgi:N utilization substance protein B
LDKHSLSFPEKRIYPADRSILLIALAEILYMNDIPDKVSVNEAANIASKYSSEKSASFITGILSAVIGGKGNV